MPELKMDDKGNITQVGFDQEKGLGQNAQFVQDDDMLKLSLVEKQSVLRDRKAIDTTQQLRQMEAVRQQQHRQNQMNSLANIRAQELEKQAQLKKNLDYARNIRGDAMKSLALSQRGQDYEQLSGVSGYGYSNGEHGARPYIDRPSRDYQYTEPVNTAFGAVSSFVEKPVPDLTDEEEQMIFEWMADRWVSVPGADPQKFSITDGVLRAPFMKTWWRNILATSPGGTYGSGYQTFEGYKYGWAQVKYEGGTRNTLNIAVPLAAELPVTLNGAMYSLSLVGRKLFGDAPFNEAHPYVQLLRAFNKAHLAELQYLKEIKIQREMGATVSAYTPMINRIMARQEEAIKRLQVAEAAAMQAAEISQQTWWVKFMGWFRGEVTRDFLADHPMLTYDLIPRRTPGGMANQVEKQLTQNATVTNQGI